MVVSVRRARVRRNHRRRRCGVGLAAAKRHDRDVTRRRVAVLGCTGSVGTQALSILADHGDRFDTVLLSAHSSARGLAEAAAAFRPRAACLTGDAARPPLPSGTAWFSGRTGLTAALDAAEPDLVLNAITGAAGLEASEWTLRHGRTLALANKESLVVAGEYLMALADRNGATILPVDSEHCAIFQCLAHESTAAVRRIWLTGSGGPFRTRPLDTFASITRDEALRHPTWTMGPRITIGSATMMNKAFEVIEAHWLFDFPAAAIEVVLHPQSIVHSMVEFVDGSILAQCGVPDMRVPIQYCLGHPERLPSSFEPFDPLKWRTLEFAPFDVDRYPAVGLAYEVLAAGGDAGAVLNAADEVATAAFLEGRIGFPTIVETVAKVLQQRPARTIRSLGDVQAADAEARRAAEDCIAAVANSPSRGDNPS
jgi:1-deoxy-D-xylulose-5-phosphate reductoisomerase